MLIDIIELTLSYIQYIMLIVAVAPPVFPTFYRSPSDILKYINLDFQDKLFSEGGRSDNFLNVEIPDNIPLDVRLWFLVVSVVLPLVLNIVGILALAGKLFILWYWLIAAGILGLTCGLFYILADDSWLQSWMGDFWGTFLVYMGVGVIVVSIVIIVFALWYLRRKERAAEGAEELREQNLGSKGEGSEEKKGNKNGGGGEGGSPQENEGATTPTAVIDIDHYNCASDRKGEAANAIAMTSRSRRRPIVSLAITQSGGDCSGAYDNEEMRVVESSALFSPRSEIGEGRGGEAKNASQISRRRTAPASRGGIAVVGSSGLPLTSVRKSLPSSPSTNDIASSLMRAGSELAKRHSAIYSEEILAEAVMSGLVDRNLEERQRRHLKSQGGLEMLVGAAGRGLIGNDEKGNQNNEDGRDRLIVETHSQAGEAGGAQNNEEVASMASLVWREHGQASASRRFASLTRPSRQGSNIDGVFLHGDKDDGDEMMGDFGEDVNKDVATIYESKSTNQIERARASASAAYAIIMERAVKAVNVHDTITRSVYAVVFAFLGFFLTRVFTIPNTFEKLTPLSREILFGFGIIFFLVAGVACVWLTLGLSHAGRVWQFKIGGFLRDNFVSILLLSVSTLYIPAVTNVIVVFNCQSLTCGPGTRLRDARSSLLYQSDSTFSVCEPCQATSVSPQSCPANLLNSLCDTEYHDTRLKSDASVSCEDVRKYFWPAAGIVFVCFVISVPFLNFLLTRLSTNLITTEFEVDPRQIEGYTEEEKFREKVDVSDNVAKFIYDPFQQRFKQWRLLFIIQKLAIVVVSAFSFNVGSVMSSESFSLMLSLVIHFICFAVNLAARPFNRKVENIFVIVTQLFLCAASAVGLCNALDTSSSRVPLVVGQIIAIASYVVPLMALAVGAMLTFRDDIALAEKRDDVSRRTRNLVVTSAEANSSRRASGEDARPKSVADVMRKNSVRPDHSSKQYPFAPIEKIEINTEIVYSSAKIVEMLMVKHRTQDYERASIEQMPGLSGSFSPWARYRWYLSSYPDRKAIISHTATEGGPIGKEVQAGGRDATRVTTPRTAAPTTVSSAAAAATITPARQNNISHSIVQTPDVYYAFSGTAAPPAGEGGVALTGPPPPPQQTSLSTFSPHRADGSDVFEHNKALAVEDWDALVARVLAKQRDIATTLTSNISEETKKGDAVQKNEPQDFRIENSQADLQPNGSGLAPLPAGKPTHNDVSFISKSRFGEKIATEADKAKARIQMVRERIRQRQEYEKRLVMYVGLQRAVDFNINTSTINTLIIFFVFCGLCSIVAFTASFLGVMSSKEGENYVGATKQLTDDGAVYQLLNFSSWDAFTSHCCCLPFSYLEPTWPNHVAEGEKWICNARNDKTSDFLARRAQQMNSGNNALSSFFSVEDWLAGGLPDTLTDTQTTKERFRVLYTVDSSEFGFIPSNSDGNNTYANMTTTPTPATTAIGNATYTPNPFSGLSIRPLCGMTFINNCTLVVDPSTRSVSISGCNENVVSPEALGLY